MISKKSSHKSVLNPNENDDDSNSESDNRHRHNDDNDSKHNGMNDDNDRQHLPNWNSGDDSDDQIHNGDEYGGYGYDEYGGGYGNKGGGHFGRKSTFSEDRLTSMNQDVWDDWDEIMTQDSIGIRLHAQLLMDRKIQARDQRQDERRKQKEEEYAMQMEDYEKQQEKELEAQLLSQGFDVGSGKGQFSTISPSITPQQGAVDPKEQPQQEQQSRLSNADSRHSHNNQATKTGKGKVFKKLRKLSDLIDKSLGKIDDLMLDSQQEVQQGQALAAQQQRGGHRTGSRGSLAGKRARFEDDVVNKNNNNNNDSGNGDFRHQRRGSNKYGNRPAGIMGHRHRTSFVPSSGLSDVINKIESLPPPMLEVNDINNSREDDEKIEEQGNEIEAIQWCTILSKNEKDEYVVKFDESEKENNNDKNNGTIEKENSNENKRFLRYDHSPLDISLDDTMISNMMNGRKQTGGSSQGGNNHGAIGSHSGGHQQTKVKREYHILHTILGKGDIVLDLLYCPIPMLIEHLPLLLKMIFQMPFGINYYKKRIISTLLKVRLISMV